MVRIRTVSEILNEQRQGTHPTFRFGWHTLEERVSDGTSVVTGIENHRFGRVERVVICKDDGSPLYDTYQIEEGPADAQGRRALSSGAVIVPYFVKENEMYIGLIERVREIVKHPSTAKQGDYVSLELPRGFGSLGEASDETAIRELGEETCRVAKGIYRLGRVNPNNAFYTTPGVSVFATQVDPQIVDHTKKDATEPILKCSFYSSEEIDSRILRQEISCGWTLSALKLFDCYKRNLLKTD